jgi:twitching motility two-component system response regulator PilH
MATILIVDDSATERAYCRKALAGLGHNIVELASGDECLAKVKDIRPDLIFLDVVMPGRNGYQTCRTLKRDSDTDSIPVVMLTSKGGEADIHWGQRQGADLYLVKPATEEQLVSAVKKYVAV